MFTLHKCTKCNIWMIHDDELSSIQNEKIIMMFCKKWIKNFTIKSPKPRPLQTTTFLFVSFPLSWSFEFLGVYSGFLCFRFGINWVVIPIEANFFQILLKNEDFRPKPLETKGDDAKVTCNVISKYFFIVFGCT